MKKLLLAAVFLSAINSVHAADDIKLEKYNKCIESIKKVVVSINAEAVENGHLSQEAAEDINKTTEVPQAYCAKKHNIYF
jgi:ribosomal protein L5